MISLCDFEHDGIKFHANRRYRAVVLYGNGRVVATCIHRHDGVVDDFKMSRHNTFDASPSFMAALTAALGAM